MNTIARFVEGYAVTTMEITTLGYIICTLGMLFFWWHKPMDVQSPLVLEHDLALSQLIDCQPHASAELYYVTPLYNIGRNEWIMPRLWTYYVNITRKLLFLRPENQSLPKQRFDSFNFPAIPLLLGIILWVISLVYAAIFVAAWNFHYPTRTEQIIWQTSSLGTVFIVLIGGICEIFLRFHDQRKAKLGVDNHHNKANAGLSCQHTELPVTRPSTESKTNLRTIKNNCSDKDPAYNLSARILYFTTPFCALYTIFRAFILLEDVLSLRQLPASTFVTIDWGEYLPHI